jgi:outer membrane putative beta-barrel porin/alpha-amylase
LLPILLSIAFTKTTCSKILDKIAVSHSLNDILGLGYNVGYNYFGYGKGDLVYSLALGVGITEKTGFYVETYGEISGFKDPVSNFDSGLTYLIKQNLQLDLSFGLGLNQKMNYFSVGCSWNIAGKKK